MLTASVSLMLGPARSAPPVGAAFDTFWIVLAIIIGSAVNEWLKKRKQVREAGSPPTESVPPPAAPRGSTTSRGAPRPLATSDWEEALRRLLGGEPPLAQPPTKPPPATPPSIGPVVIEQARTSQRSPPLAAAPAAARTPPLLAESSMAEAERAVDIQLPGLSESAAAYQRADHLHQGVSEHLKQIDDLTQSHSGKVPLSGRRTYSPDVARARVLIRNPRTVRQAIIASLIFGPPRALEE